MTHAQIGGRFGAQQVAGFLTDVSRELGLRFIVSSPTPEVYRVYATQSAQLVFSGSADYALEFIEGNKETNGR